MVRQVNLGPRFGPDSQPGGLSGFGGEEQATCAVWGWLREVSSWSEKSLCCIWICVTIESYFAMLCSPFVISKCFICLIQVTV